MIEKINRLRQMSNAEIRHRLREQVRRRVDKMHFRARFRLDEDRELDQLIQCHGSSLKTYFIHGPARRFYPSTQDRGRISDFIYQRYPEWLDRAIQKADNLCEHRVNLLAHRNVPLAPNIDWHRDPISGCEWPLRYWTEYDTVHSPPADIKNIHELNRHQHLPCLAKAFFLTGQESYAREAVDQIDSWIEQNSKWNGINWQSSLELALRSMSWLWTIFLLLPSESLDEAALRRICKSLFAQMDHVYRYPSVYTSPNTHLIGEAAALFIAGVLFPELPRAGNWRHFGAETLTNEMRRQALGDGVYCELSSYYHCYAADFYLHVLALAQWNKTPFPEWVWARLSSMLDFVMHLTRSDGTIPLIGDDDGGRVLAIASDDYRSYRDGLCSGAVMFRRGDYKYQAQSFCEESLWLLGQDAWPIFDAIPAATPSDLRLSCKEAGYFIHRSGWETGDSQLVFDCGGMGWSSGGHAHADALSFTLFAGGRELLIDPATAVYNCAPEWRNFFRSTPAHNTVVVDGQSQSNPGSTFGWKTRAEARLRQEISLPDIDYIDGEHDGYMRLSKAITHRRRLVYIRPNYWIVLDDLSGKGEHDFEFLYHFASEAQLTVFGDEKQGGLECQARIGDTGLQLFMYASEAIRTEAVCGQTEPIQGWSSKRYGDRGPNPVLRTSVRGSAPVSMMSFLVPGNQVRLSRRFSGNSNRTIPAAIRDGDYDDIAITAVDDGELRLMDFTMRGEFFWIRLENGEIRRLFAVNAHSFSYSGETIFESRQRVPYVHAYFWENGLVIERGDEGTMYVRELGKGTREPK